LQDCSGNRSQSDSGASVAVGWRNDVWSGDYGTKQMGYKRVGLVGAILCEHENVPFGFDVYAQVRALLSLLPDWLRHTAPPQTIRETHVEELERHMGGGG
ncbi:cellulose synthase subunit BcsC-related outer membrane protein, partial [Escherichia coli]|uniref:cellulose synthase subunit BcsC-related outer membrane protein n=1 Tax=Escherichia coli TaxID=562 RepID=UPI00148584B3